MIIDKNYKGLKEVDGNYEISGDLEIEGDLEVNLNKWLLVTGSINATKNIISNNYLRAVCGIEAGGGIEAGLSMKCARN